MFLVLPSCCHRFHYDCVRPWLEQNKTFPMCRTRCVITMYDNDQDLQSREIVGV